MTVFYDTADVEQVATSELALSAARRTFELEANGQTHLSPRIDTTTPTGFYRCMPAVFGDVMGLKIMTLVRGLGNRYLLLLHSVATGELIAVFDAEQVTARRTAAVTVLAGQSILSSDPTAVSLIGTGMEAASHLEMMAAVWPLENVVVWSRSEENRRAFSEHWSGRLGISVEPASSPADAVKRHPLVVLATKSTVPVLDGRDLAPGSTVLSIGSTRPDLRELDVATLRRSVALVVDNPEQVVAESGDIQAAFAEDALRSDHLIALKDLIAGDRAGLRTDSERDLVSFKSVGTALQDLALASAIHDAAPADRGRELGNLTELKLPGGRK